MNDVQVYELICEGSCNHHLVGQLDRIALQERIAMQVLSRTTLVAFKRLRHTTHVQRRPDVFVCMDCGTERRYGHTIDNFDA